MGFVRVAVVSPELRVADVEFNVLAIVKALRDAAAEGCQLALFPELSVTGYSCADLFYQASLLNAARNSLQIIAQATEQTGVAVVVGLPLAAEGRLYCCAAFISEGFVRGIVPKTFLPSVYEYYEERWFSSGRDARVRSVPVGNAAVPFGTDLLFQAANLPECVVGIEICEDLWAVQPVSGELATAGATLLLNPSGSNELLGKADYRRELVKQQSARCLAAYLYAGSGPGESSTDMVFGGHSLIVENGALLAETERFHFETQMAIADVDVQRLVHERLRNSAFSSTVPTRPVRSIGFAFKDIPPNQTRLRRPLLRNPFVPPDPAQRAERCREIFAIQSTGLAKRLRHTGQHSTVIGISGGLDSTLALLVTVKAFDIMKWPRAGILAVTMPGFGTTSRTRGNAEKLITLLGATLKVIPISDAVRQHFKDIGHDESVHDITYENAQSRERMQILMDLANSGNGLVVGTGDLSEIALGWCTYNGDQMSMYNVNCGVPKTLVRYMVEWVAESEFSGPVSEVLRDIGATPISPELLPLGKDASLKQKTEETIGPYELHDFFLYQAIRNHFPPRKILFLAWQAFGEDYSAECILRWMGTFYRRFFSQQFKRSPSPDGPKIGSVALSPRGDWRMPSDARPDLWLKEIADLVAEHAAH